MMQFYLLVSCDDDNGSYHLASPMQLLRTAQSVHQLSVIYSVS